MRGTYHLSGDYKTSIYTDPMHAGRTQREIVFRPDDGRMPDVAVCTIFTSRADAEIILAALIERVRS